MPRMQRAATHETVFDLGESVNISLTGESGYVDEICLTMNSEDRYLVIYADKNGCRQKNDFASSELQPIGTYN